MFMRFAHQAVPSSRSLKRCMLEFLGEKLGAETLKIQVQGSEFGDEFFCYMGSTVGGI